MEREVRIHSTGEMSGDQTKPRDGERDTQTDKRGRGRPRKEDKVQKERETMEKFLRARNVSYNIAFPKKNRIEHSPPSRSATQGSEDNRNDSEGALEDSEDKLDSADGPLTGTGLNRAPAPQTETNSSYEITEIQNNITINMNNETSLAKDDISEQILPKEKGEIVSKSASILGQNEIMNIVRREISAAKESWATEMEIKMRGLIQEETRVFRERISECEATIIDCQNEIEVLQEKTKALYTWGLDEQSRRIKDKKVLLQALRSSGLISDTKWERKHSESQNNSDTMEEAVINKGQTESIAGSVEHDDTDSEKAYGKRTDAQAEVEWCEKNMPDKLGAGELEYELQERLKRKQNIMVRGVKVPVGIEKVRPIGGGLLIKLYSFKNKVKIMRKKAELKGTRIWLGDDLTEREQQIQEWLRARARVEKNKGNDVRVGFAKIKINSVWKIWNETTGKLEDDKEHNGEERSIGHETQETETTAEQLGDRLEQPNLTFDDEATTQRV